MGCARLDPGVSSLALLNPQANACDPSGVETRPARALSRRVNRYFSGIERWKQTRNKDDTAILGLGSEGDDSGGVGLEAGGADEVEAVGDRGHDGVKALGDRGGLAGEIDD